uniref:Uncharacterized protein n=1 Tax=Glossina brevipalpis TaxID=37001 RepID=A0A1A9WUZ1_9MUSC
MCRFVASFEKASVSQPLNLSWQTGKYTLMITETEIKQYRHNNDYVSCNKLRFVRNHYTLLLRMPLRFIFVVIFIASRNTYRKLSEMKGFSLKLNLTEVHTILSLHTLPIVLRK